MSKRDEDLGFWEGALHRERDLLTAAVGSWRQQKTAGVLEPGTREKVFIANDRYAPVIKRPEA